MTLSPAAVDLGSALRERLLESHRTGPIMMAEDVIFFLRERTAAAQEMIDGTEAALEEEHTWMRSHPYTGEPEHLAHAKVLVTLFIVGEYLKAPSVAELEFNDADPDWLDADALARIKKDMAALGE